MLRARSTRPHFSTLKYFFNQYLFLKDIQGKMLSISTVYLNLTFKNENQSFLT